MDKIVCQNCGTECDDTALVCPKCMRNPREPRKFTPVGPPAVQLLVPGASGAPEDYRPCGQCGGLVPVGAPRCSGCGATMPEEPYYVFAPWWMRWMATWADVFIVAIPVIGILAVVGVQTDGPNAPDWPSFVIVGALFLYWTVLESWKGWTVGKLIFGTRVLAENEGSVRTWQGAVRTVFKLFGIGPLSFFTLGFILFSKKSQRLGDMAARTIVVRNVTKRIEREYRQRYGDQTAVPFIPPAPGWHPDPTGRNEHRYWDGSKWTEHVSTNGVQTTDAP